MQILSEAEGPVSNFPKLLVAPETASRAADVTDDATLTVKLVVAATSPMPKPNMPSSSIEPPVISFSVGCDVVCGIHIAKLIEV